MILKIIRIATVLVVTAGLAMALTGCGEVRQAWKETKKYYIQNLEPAPSIDLSTESLGSYDERHLARLFHPVDSKIQEMVFYFDQSDAEPDSAWLEELFYRFPWIGGIMTLDQGGYVYFQYPPDASEGVSALDLLALDDYQKDEAAPDEEATEDMVDENEDRAYVSQPWDDRGVRSMVSGQQVYMATPIFTDNIFSGLKVIHYDPRNLLEYCPEPAELVIVADGQVVWAGDHAAAAQELAIRQSEGRLDGSASGSFSVDGRSYQWVSRNLGKLYLYYAAEIIDVAGEEADPS